MMSRSLWDLLATAVAAHADRPAIREATGRAIDYRGLIALADAVATGLAAEGVQRGDRVGVYLRKSIESVASFFGILKVGAAYVPVDPTSPVSRNAFILHDCQVRATIVEASFAEGCARALRELGDAPRQFTVTDVGVGGEGMRKVFTHTHSLPPVAIAEGDPAYILYTSGSTGKPKGVVLSHQSALAFIDWCAELLLPTPEDRFGNHAPFHFDISVLDLFTSLRHGAELVLVPEKAGKEPASLARYIAQSGITVWYSTPSVLTLMARYGNLEELDLTSLRAVLFAGEVFPVAALRSLMQKVSHPKYYNLYGPTETNVCTFHALPGPPSESQTESIPIGKPCPHYEAKVVSLEGRACARGSEGELVVRGAGVMLGYWNRPEATAAAFIPDPDGGAGWYRTGDVVVEEPSGDYRFVERHDRMIKKRGYRVELGEIEACLNQHTDIHEAAVVAVQHPAHGVLTTAHVSAREGKELSIIELKSFCAKRLPAYMVPDFFRILNALPRTSTHKLDYQYLTQLASKP